jgi:hypothetical protein
MIADSFCPQNGGRRIQDTESSQQSVKKSNVSLQNRSDLINELVSTEILYTALRLTNAFKCHESFEVV